MEKGSQHTTNSKKMAYIKIDLCPNYLAHSYRYIHHIENKYGYLVIRVGSGLF